MNLCEVIWTSENIMTDKGNYECCCKWGPPLTWILQVRQHLLLFRKSDFLYFKVSNSNMQILFFWKKTFFFVIRTLRYFGYLTVLTWCVCQVVISKTSDNFYFLTTHTTSWGPEKHSMSPPGCRPLFLKPKCHKE